MLCRLTTSFTCAQNSMLEKSNSAAIDAKFTGTKLKTPQNGITFLMKPFFILLSSKCVFGLSNLVSVHHKLFRTISASTTTLVGLLRSSREKNSHSDPPLLFTFVTSSFRIEMPEKYLLSITKGETKAGAPKS